MRGPDLLGAWALYFVAKLVLFACGSIDLHPLEDLALMAALAVPIASARWRRARLAVALPLALALLYHESWLPPASRALSQAGLLAEFRIGYLLELGGRFLNGAVVAMLAAAAVAYFVAARFVRTDVFVAVAVLAAAFVPAGSPQPAPGPSMRPAATPDQVLADFLASEARRSVAFAAPPAASPPFDVIFIHVCSLSWDDLRAAGLEGHPLMKGFDIVLRRFNSVSSYSGPSAIRLLRASCGQPSHRALYEPAAPECLLMPALAKAGFETALLLNHDGHFDDFLTFVRRQGVDVPPMPLDGVAVTQRAFDDSRVRDDLAVLSRWAQQRGRTTAPRLAVYYNTVSLHDGNRPADGARQPGPEAYQARLTKLLDEIDAFVRDLDRAGRRAIVVMVPEHGAALRGDALQIAGLRDIPTPAITLVPVGIRVVGPDARRVGAAVAVDEPTSYLGLSHVVAAMAATPPFGPGGFRAAEYTKGVPGTDFVSENESATVLGRGAAYLWRQGTEPWKEFRPGP